MLTEFIKFSAAGLYSLQSAATLLPLFPAGESLGTRLPHCYKASRLQSLENSAHKLHHWNIVLTSRFTMAWIPWWCDSDKQHTAFLHHLIMLMQWMIICICSCHACSLLYIHICDNLRVTFEVLGLFVGVRPYWQAMCWCLHAKMVCASHIVASNMSSIVYLVWNRFHPIFTFSL